MEQISQRELRDDSGRIMRMVAQGHSFVVTSHSQPIGELRPLLRRRLINSRVAVNAFRSAPHIDHIRLRDDLDEYIDSTIGHDR